MDLFTDLDQNNFAPRAGLALQATPQTVVRGAYGGFCAFQDVCLDTRFRANALTELVPQFASCGSHDFQVRPTYVQQRSITLERHSILFGASYVGNKGAHLGQHFSSLSRH